MSEPEPDQIQFACIGCGALNPMDAATCSGCGHDFGRPPAPASPGSTGPLPSRRPIPAPNPYAPPTSDLHRRPTFRIGTAMIVVAVIAVGLGAFAADEALGIGLSIGLIPATIRLAWLSSRGDVGGRAMRAGDLALAFILTFVMSYLILIASVIAFGVTCFPFGMVSQNIVVGVVAGGVAAIFVGIKLTRATLAASRRTAEANWHDSQIHWK
ncbi:hypothetical protein TA3x_000668 [Tundrisphaera sp. TA3]|uniref:hypothetical protein n=1 Tax=Tundrisphaera sp. TA3 TaxID=3435775 RepID=UPI003EB83CE2